MKQDGLLEAETHDELVRGLANRLVTMEWLTPDSDDARQFAENQREVPNDQLRGLIAACDRCIADPPCCG